MITHPIADHWFDLHGHEGDPTLYKFLIYITTFYKALFPCMPCNHFIVRYLCLFIYLALRPDFKKMVQFSIPKDQTSLPSSPISAIWSIRKPISIMFKIKFTSYYLVLTRKDLVISRKLSRNYEKRSDDCQGGVKISWVRHASEINSECSNPCRKGRISLKLK